MITAHTTVFRDGEELAKMYPAKWFFRKHEDQPTTEVAIRRSITEDIYLVMPAFNLEEQSASMEIVDQPAGELGLGRLRHPGDRHGHRAAAGDGVRVRRREDSGECRDDVAAAAVAAAVAGGG